MLANNKECSTLILSFRTGFPVPYSSEMAESIIDTPSRGINQQSSVVKHAVIRREVKPQSSHSLVNSVSSSKSSLEFDDLDDEEDANILLSRNRKQIKLQQRGGEYLYKCGKLGPYGSLLQILR